MPTKYSQEMQRSEDLIEIANECLIKNKFDVTDMDQMAALTMMVSDFIKNGSDVGDMDIALIVKTDHVTMALTELPPDELLALIRDLEMRITGKIDEPTGSVQ